MPWLDEIMPPFRDEEAEVLALIDHYFTVTAPETVYSGDRTPDDVEANLPFVRVGRVGGAPDRTQEHTDKPVVDIDVLATTRGQAKRIAQVVEQLLMSHPHPIDDCNVLMGPQRVEWAEDSPIQRFYASYHLSLRR